MLRKLGPSIVFAMLGIGFATPALADVIPPEPKEEPKPKLYEVPPEEPETKTEEPQAKSEAKAEAPETKSDAKKAADKKAGNCSIDAGDDRNLLGLAALVLVISGAALRRRRR